MAKYIRNINKLIQREYIMEGIMELDLNKIKVMKIILVSFIIGVLFYILNVYTSLFADDYSYSYSFLTWNKISSINDIIQSQIAHYQIMNGRSVTHFFAQLFLYIGKPIFNIINTCVFISLIFLIYFHSYGTFKNFNIFWFVWIGLILWNVTPKFGQSFLWLTGSTNYLYGIFIILVFLIPYKIKLNNNVKEKKINCILEIFKALIYFAFGVIAGWTNENTSVALIIMIGSFLIIYKLQNKCYKGWMFTGLLGSIIGCILMLKAPGQTSRLVQAGGFGNIISWVKRFCFISFNVFEYLIPIILFLAFCIIIYLYLKKDKNYFELAGVVIYFLGSMTAIYSMIAAPFFPERSWSGPIIIFVICLGNLYSLINWNSNKLIKTVSIAMILLCSLNFFGSYANAYFELKQIKIQSDSREYYIKKEKEKGNLNVEIETIKSRSKYSCFDYEGDLSENKNEWPNTAISRYYGLESVSKR